MSEKTSETTLEERFCKCPYATAQRLIAGKLSILILHCLDEGALRFNELQRVMPKMSHATLSVQLKSLVDHGLIKGTQYETIPLRVEYELTGIGKKFRPVIDALKTWGKEYIETMGLNTRITEISDGR